MCVLKKAIFYLRQQGVFPTLKLILIYLWDCLRMTFFAAAFYLGYPFRKAALSRRFAGRKLIVYTPTVEWNFLYARAQQLAVSFGARGDCVAVYLSTQRHYDNVLGWKELAPNVFLANVRLAKRLDGLAKDAEAVISSVYNITNVDVLDRYHSDKVIYEYVDDLHLVVSDAVDFAPWEKKHQDLLRSADLAVATATVLYHEILPYAAHPVLLPNAVDYDFFAKPAEERPELKALRRGYACVIGYYGALASWFDYDAVRASAEAHPEWLWLLIGKEIGSDMKDSGVLQLPNVKWIPPVPYSALPSYVASTDLLTIPFVINETTLATSPVKLFEYMAAGKPILTSDLPECRKYESVHIYHDPEELISLIPQALARREDAAYQSTLRREALENTWIARREAELAGLGMGE